MHTEPGVSFYGVRKTGGATHPFYTHPHYTVLHTHPRVS